MTNWKTCELESVCSRLSSGKGISAKLIKDNAFYPVYGGNGIRGYSSTSNFKGECAIIGRQGAYCGNVRYFKGEAYMTEHAVVVCANEDNSTRYLAYLLATMNLGRLSGQSAQPGLSVKTLGKLEIRIPSKSIQDKIAGILGIIDEKISHNQKINDNLLQQTSSIYQAWFEDFILSDGICPSTWQQGTLSDIADVSSGKRPPVKSAEKTDTAIIPLVGAASVMGFTTEANHSDKILVTGRVGTHGVIQRFNSPCWTSDNTLVITSDYYEYTYQILQRIDYHSLNRGSTQPLVTQGDMNKVPILIPDEETISNYESIAGHLMAQYQYNFLEISKLVELRDTLLPCLMSGELDVSNIDI